MFHPLHSTNYDNERVAPVTQVKSQGQITMRQMQTDEKKPQAIAPNVPSSPH